MTNDEQSPNIQTPTDDFQPVCAANEVVVGKLKSITVADQPIILTRIADQIHAFTAICPHAFGNLGYGRLVDNNIECPVHGWLFCVTGEDSANSANAGMPLDCYAVREEDGTVYLKLN